MTTKTFLKNNLSEIFAFGILTNSPSRSTLGPTIFFPMDHNEKLNTLFGHPSQLGGTISFCYLDGDHSKDQVKNDIEHIDAILEDNGFRYFDDSDKYHLDAGKIRNGCYDIVREALASGRYEVAVSNPNYLLKKIRSEQ